MSFCIEDNRPWECQGNFPFSEPLGHSHHTRVKLPMPSWLWLCSLLTVNYPVPTYGKEACVSHFSFYPIQEVSCVSPHHTLLSAASLIYHRWTSCNPLTPPVLVVMYEIRCGTAILWSICQSVEILLPGNCHQFGTNKLTKNSLQIRVFLVLTLPRPGTSRSETQRYPLHGQAAWAKACGMWPHLPDRCSERQGPSV